MAAFNSNGSIDTSFGTDGLLTTDIGQTAEGDCIMIDNRGHLVVAGNAGSSDIFVARYTPGGGLDTTFGADGISLIAPTRDSLRVDSEAMQHGSILLVGQIATPSGGKVLITRLTASGAPYGSPFGNPDPTGVTEWDSLAVLANGTILTAGSDNRFPGFTETDGALGWYNGDGTLDTTMGDNGLLTFDPGVGAADSAQFRQVRVMPDGKILVAGVETNTSTNDTVSMLVRFDANGRVDATFGTDGMVTTDFGTTDQQFNDAKIETDGTIVAAGGSPTTDQENIAAFINDLDTTPPTASLTPVPEITSDTSNIQITVTYQDNELIDPLSIRQGNVEVEYSGHYASPIVTTVGRERVGGPITVVYTMNGPFTAKDNGIFTILIYSSGSQPADTSGNSVPGGTLGTFQIDI